MDLSTWAFILLGISVVALVSELFIPSGGVLGVVGALAMIGCIVVCFRINQYLGVGVLVAVAIASPFAFGLAMKIWPRTPIGRRMMLQPTESLVQPPAVVVGAVGRALTQLRPMGTCEFGTQRVEVRSELGIIPAGSDVVVSSIDSGRVIVRKA